MPTAFDGGEWVLLEVMGHRRHWGYAKQVHYAGVELCEISIPGENAEEVTSVHRYGGASIFCVTPVSERAVRDACARERAYRARPLLPSFEQAMQEPEEGDGDDNGANSVDSDGDDPWSEEEAADG